MAFLYMQPTALVPILLGVLIILVFIGIIALAAKRRRQERMHMQRNLRKMKELQTAVARVSVPDLTIRKTVEQDLKRTETKKSVAKKTSGDRTIYDDRKNLSAWQVHLSKTYRDMKKKNPKATFQAAMKAAKKTYKKK